MVAPLMSNLEATIKFPSSHSGWKVSQHRYANLGPTFFEHVVNKDNIALCISKWRHDFRINKLPPFEHFLDSL